MLHDTLCVHFPAESLRVEIIDKGPLEIGSIEVGENDTIEDTRELIQQLNNAPKHFSIVNDFNAPYSEWQERNCSAVSLFPCVRLHKIARPIKPGK